MATATQARSLTAEEFMAADLGEGTFELVRGEIVKMPPPMPEHGRVCVNVGFVLESHGRRSGLGYTLSNDSAVLIERGPDTVRGADVCFYSHARWPRSEVGRILPPVPPDLVVEVASPSNRPGTLFSKIGEYLDAGVLLVWVVYPSSRRVAVYRPDQEDATFFNEGDFLENFPELPGFQCAVADLFL